VLSSMNEVRARYGLAPLRMAEGVRNVARDRSQSMQDQHYFDHVSPSGVTASTLLRRRGIGYRSWTENIGWTSYMDLTYAPEWMVSWWKDSPSHRRNMLSRDYNYAGVGITRQGAKILYTVVFVNQADHTPPRAGLVSAFSGISLASVTPTRSVTVRWFGADRRLATRTAGLAGFTVQYRAQGGHWKLLRKLTTARQLTTRLPKGMHFFRVRAADNVGNRSQWMRPLKVVVR
jgi:hypothetical protein